MARGSYETCNAGTSQQFRDSRWGPKSLQQCNGVRYIAAPKCAQIRPGQIGGTTRGKPMFEAENPALACRHTVTLSH